MRRGSGLRNASTGAGPARGVWWLSPAGAASLVVPVTVLLAWILDDAYFRRAWGTAKFLTHDTLTLVLTGALLFTLGALLPLLWAPARGRPAPSSVDLDLLRSAGVVLYRLTVLGYAALLFGGLVRGARPSDLLDALRSQDASSGVLREQFAYVAGVTTLTQLGIAYVIVSLTVLIRRRDRYLFWRLVIVLGLGLLRAYFLTERLAILELAIPALGILAMQAARSGGTARRAVAAAPFVLAPAVVVLFGLFEYSRSWVFYSRTTEASFLEFVLNRIAGYYATAYNNGAIVLEYGDVQLPYSSVEAIWTAPGVAQLELYGRLTGQDYPAQYGTLLQQYGNPELNSPGGLVVPFVDFGPAGGLVFLFLVGLALAWTYRRWRDGALWAALSYPVALTGVLELPRYLYWGQGRVMPAFVAVLAVVWVARRRARRQGTSTGAPSAAAPPVPAATSPDPGRRNGPRPA